MTDRSIRRRMLAASGALWLAAAWPAQATDPMSDAAALARRIGPDVVVLNTERDGARDIMRRALDFGMVTARTVNPVAVMERTGVAMRLESEGGVPVGQEEGAERARNLAGGYVGGDIDLRFDFSAWHQAYAVTQPSADGRLERSLQFFDGQGATIHRLTLRNEAAGGLFDKLALDLRAPEQRPPQPSAAAAAGVAAPAEKPDSAIDVARFRQAWLAMADPGQFGPLLAEFGVTRAQALRLAPPGMVRRLASDAVAALFDGVTKQRLAIVALAGNAGVTQIYTGTVTGAAADGADYVVQAPGFSLRLRGGTHGAHGAYAVQRAGAVSVEWPGPDGEPAVTLNGVRDRARPLAWTELVKALP